MSEEEIIKNTKIALDLYSKNNGCVIDKDILQDLLDIVNQKEKIIDLMINDLQEYVFSNYSKEEILEFYKNM